MPLDPFIDVAPHGAAIYRGTAPPSAAGEGTFRLGDMILYNGSAVGKPFGWVCITAGDGSTSVWRSMPILTVNLWTIGGATAADYDAAMWTCPTGMSVRLIEVVERHGVAGSDAGAVTLMVKKVASGTAKASGTDMLSAGLNLKATADTNQAGSLTATVANLALAAGNSVALVASGTLTAVDAVSVTLVFTIL